MTWSLSASFVANAIALIAVWLIPSSLLAEVPALSYDGSYDPYTLTPPPGQTTWLKQAATIDPIPNFPSPGLALFSDTSGSGRIQMSYALGADLRESGYQWEALVSFSNVVGTVGYAAFGMRDEGGPGPAGQFGKGLMLSFFPPPGEGMLPQLRLNADARITGGIQINDVDYVDNQFHHFRVEKVPVANDFNVQVYVDDVPQLPDSGVLYSTLQDAAQNTLGFGYFSFGTGVGDVTIDEFTLSPLNSAQPGDFDGDGDVDGADFVAWQTNFPKASDATLSEGDADGDGDVDGADFVVWQTNFPFTPSPGTAPVPEPASAVLVLLCGIAALTARQMRRFSDCASTSCR